jgi:hypothetical protein
MEPAEGRETEGGRGFLTGGEVIGLEEHGGGERSGGFGKVLGMESLSKRTAAEASRVVAAAVPEAVDGPGRAGPGLTCTHRPMSVYGSPA